MQLFYPITSKYQWKHNSKWCNNPQNYWPCTIPAHTTWNTLWSPPKHWIPSNQMPHLPVGWWGCVTQSDSIPATLDNQFPYPAALPDSSIVLHSCQPPHPPNKPHLGQRVLDQDIILQMDCMIQTLQALVWKTEHALYLFSCNQPPFLLPINPKLASNSNQPGWLGFCHAFPLPPPVHLSHHTIATCDTQTFLTQWSQKHNLKPP